MKKMIALFLCLVVLILALPISAVETEDEPWSYSVDFTKQTALADEWVASNSSKISFGEKGITFGVGAGISMISDIPQDILSAETDHLITIKFNTDSGFSSRFRWGWTGSSNGDYNVLSEGYSPAGVQQQSNMWGEIRYQYGGTDNIGYFTINGSEAPSDAQNIYGRTLKTEAEVGGQYVLEVKKRHSTSLKNVEQVELSLEMKDGKCVAAYLTMDGETIKYVPKTQPTPKGYFFLYLVTGSGEVNVQSVEIKEGSYELPLVENVIPTQPVSVNYTLEGEVAGLANGTVTITMPENHNTDDIQMWWGDENGKLAGYTQVATVSVPSRTTTEVVYQMRENTFIPSGATKLILYPMSDIYGISDDFTELSLPENAANVIDGKLIAEFQVVSDTHLGRTTTADKNYENMLKDIAENSPNSDAIFVVGDIANRGDDSASLKKFWDIYDSIEGLPHLYIARGNHLGYDLTLQEDLQLFLSMLRLPDGQTKPSSYYYDQWINGLHFIVLGDTAKGHTDATIGDAQYDWLEEKITESDAKQPVFVFLHQVLDSVVDPARMKTILKEHPNVILFNGHTHDTMESVGLDEGGAVGESAIFNTSTTREPAQSEGYYIQVYEDRIFVRGRDFLTGKWISYAQYMLTERYAVIEDDTTDNQDPPSTDDPVNTNPVDTSTNAPIDTTAPIDPSITTEPMDSGDADASLLGKMGCSSTVVGQRLMALFCMLGTALIVSKKHKKI